MSRKLFSCSAFAALCLCSLVGQSVSAQQFVGPVNVNIKSTVYPPAWFFGVYGIADFNHDGRKDILALFSIPNSAGEYAVLLANSDGSYTPQLTGINLPHDPQATFEAFDTREVADVDGDGRPDIVIVTSPGYDAKGNPLSKPLLKIYLGNGDGTFRSVPPVILASSFAQIALVSDLNKDGKPDLVIQNLSNATDSTPTFTVWTNQGGGNFNEAYSLPVTGRPLLAHGDFNGDGFPDVVMSTPSGMQILLNTRAPASPSDSPFR
jgi:hypothetical protein